MGGQLGVSEHPSWHRPLRGLPFARQAYQVGDLIVVRGQCYVLSPFERYTRKDGSRTRLAHWQSLVSGFAEVGSIPVLA